jgi:hypothetical protein
LNYLSGGVILAPLVNAMGFHVFYAVPDEAHNSVNVIFYGQNYPRIRQPPMGFSIESSNGIAV